MANARSPGQKLKLAAFTGDYTYLMERLPDQSTGVIKIGPDQIRFGGFARRLPAHAAMRLKVNEAFLQSAASGSCRMRVTYFDESSGGSFAMAAGGRTWPVPGKGGKIWRTAAFDLPASAIRPAPDGAQIVIQNADLPVCLHMVEIERE